MDLGAYAQIDILDKIMEDNKISVPRLRGLRLMKDEEPLSREDINDVAWDHGLWQCEQMCRSIIPFKFDPWCTVLSRRTDRIVKKYLITDDEGGRLACGRVTGIRWDKVHGKKRKAFKYALRKEKKKAEEQYRVWNKYAGRDDILYIHARIGGANWKYYEGDEYVASQPWFLEKVDDSFDNTYCDIYAKIKSECQCIHVDH